MNTAEWIAYVAARYQTPPEYLWPEYPQTFVFRHAENRKWFGVVMDVERAKLGLPEKREPNAIADEEVRETSFSKPQKRESERVFLIDVKTGPIIGGSYLGQPGIVKAWHMNKNHWLGILLDGSADDQTIKELLDISYSMTR